MHRVVFCLALRRNLVVRLRKNAVKGRELRVEAKCAKREYLGHEFSGVLVRVVQAIKQFLRAKAQLGA